jgi:MFS family permease
MAAGALVIAAATLPALLGSYAALLVSRLLVGIGEGTVMAAGVLWLLRLAGSARRGRALGHSGLALFAGLTLGPLVSTMLGGDAQPRRVFVAAAILPLIGFAALLAADAGPVAGLAARREPARIARAVVRPGAGLLLVNLGYAALLAFGAHGLGGNGAALLPVYAVTVIAVRLLGASLLDRLGGTRTLSLAAPTGAVGLAAIALLPPLGALAGAVVLGVGQALIVPALGLLAIEATPPNRHGAASGLFYAGFDLGVGLGGPLAGAVAGLAGPSAALLTGAAAVALVRPAAAPLRSPRDGADPGRSGRARRGRRSPRETGSGRGRWPRRSRVGAHRAGPGGPARRRA